MADKKITQLTNITGANLVDADEFVVVDISADETKAITLGELKEAFDSGSGFVRITGDTMTGDLALSGADVTFGDNDKAIFGAGSDLQIYHDSATGTSYINENGSSNLQISATNFLLRDSSGANSFMYAINGAEVGLFHNNTQRLTTTATGIDVTGTVTADALTVENTSGATLNVNTGLVGADSKILLHEGSTASPANGASIRYAGSTNEFSIGVGSSVDTKRLSIARDTGDISFYEDTGTTPKLAWSASNERLFLSGSDYQFGIGQGANEPWYNRAVSDGSYRLHLNGTGDVVTLDSSGNVGIGTSSPARELTVKGGLLGFRNDTTGYATTDGFDIGISGTNAYLAQRENADIIIETNGTERMRIDSSGNVGIGTTSPAQKLHVNGGQYTGLRLETTNALGASYIDFGDNSDGDVGGIVYWHTDNSMRFVANASERMRLDASGNVGIGTSSPTNFTNGTVVEAAGGSNTGAFLASSNSGTVVAEMQANNADGLTYFGSRTNHPVVFRQSGFEKMRIDSSGNVGIGTTSNRNSTKLDVLGDVTFGADVNWYGTLSYDAGAGYLGLRSRDGGFKFFKGSGSTEQMRIDYNSGNLLVGTTSDYAENVQAAFYGASNGGISLASGTSGLSRLMFADGVAGTAGAYVGSIIYSHADDSLRFNVNGGTERMRIDSSGRLLVNRTSEISGGRSERLQVSGAPGAYAAIATEMSATTGQDHITFHNPNGYVGSINTSGSSTTYSTSSDYRLKTDAQPMTGASARVQALNPVNFEWIVDGTRVDGFLAHEAQAVVPEAVTGTKDAVDADGNPEYQGIDQSKLVPLLTAALQEALTKIDALETRITALEG